jgi:hypothetical protein
MKAIVILMLTCLAVAAAAAEPAMIEKLYQDEDIALKAPAGGQIFKLIRKEPIRSASGQTDAFGRAYERGFRELRYQGLAADGRPVLRYIEVAIQPGGVKVPLKLGVKGRSGKFPAGVVSYSRDQSIQTHATKAEPLAENATDIVVDLSKSREFRFGTVIVSITSADKASLEYRLHQDFSAAR